MALERLILLCRANDCTDIIIERARQILDISKDWTLTDAERKSLYKSIATTLDSLDDSTNAFKIMHAYIKLFTEDDAQGIEASQAEAKRCVILAIRAVDVINFAELVDLPAIKSLQAKNADLIKLLNLLSQSSAQDFAGQLGSLKKLIDAEGLTEKELITKKSYVQICTLDTNTSNFKYEELS